MMFILALAILDYIVTFIVQGLSLASILSFISTLLFCGRKVKYYVSPKTVIMLEGFGMFITYSLKVLLHHFDLMTFLIVILLRIIFLCIMYYDEKVWVYYSKEIRKEIKNE